MASIKCIINIVFIQVVVIVVYIITLVLTNVVHGAREK